ncbi:MAG: dual specificity protein phosphatase family protein [Bdellovibrionota bacterium]
MQRRLHIYWIDVPVSSRQIGLSVLPGRQDQKRDLKQDLEVLKTSGVADVVCLVTHAELSHFGVSNLIKSYIESGFNVHEFPIHDGDAPQPEGLRKLIADMEIGLSLGRKILLHCVGGLGRSGLVAACFLKSRGFSTENAIAIIRKQRSHMAIETAAQEQFVESYC